ncbi:homoserine kinase [Pseudomonas putida S11]|nr:homoserine kinase [Pseudomonas putida S11]
MPFFIELLDTLHAADMPVPYAIRDRDGNGLRELCGKPALLQPRLSGKHIKAPNAPATAPRSASCWRTFTWLPASTSSSVVPTAAWTGCWLRVPSCCRALPPSKPRCCSRRWMKSARTRHRVLALPRANLHADLFRDNVMFEGTHLTGVIDFYNACSGPMLYDIAITVNDWCLDEHGAIDVPRAQALLAAYAALRPFTAAEAELWPEMLRVGCVRFWLSRLIAAESFAGMDVMIHDPSEFEVRLAQRQQVALHLPFAL